MSDTDRLSRRRLFRLVAGVAGVGFASGAGSYALTQDEESLMVELGSTAVDIQLAGETGEGPADEFVNDDSVALSFDGITRGETGSASLAIRSCVSPAQVGLGVTAIAGSASPLLDELELLATVIPSNEPSQSVFDGTLGDFLETFGEPELLGGCVGCDPTILELAWSLPESATADVEGERVQLRTDFTASPCSAAGQGTEAN